MLVGKTLPKHSIEDVNSYYIIPQDKENSSILERSGNKFQLEEELPIVIDFHVAVIKSSGLYGKKDKVLHKELPPLKPIQPKCYVKQHIRNPRTNKMDKNG